MTQIATRRASKSQSKAGAETTSKLSSKASAKKASKDSIVTSMPKNLTEQKLSFTAEGAPPPGKVIGTTPPDTGSEDTASNGTSPAFTEKQGHHQHPASNKNH